jgi:hypothetical protein
MTGTQVISESIRFLTPLPRKTCRRRNGSNLFPDNKARNELSKFVAQLPQTDETKVILYYINSKRSLE